MQVLKLEHRGQSTKTCLAISNFTSCKCVQIKSLKSLTDLIKLGLDRKYVAI